jgi:hypothetical protein
MSSARKSGATPGTDAAADARSADACCALDIMTSITELLQIVAVSQRWRTLNFSASDVMTLRRALRTCQQSLNRVESEIDNRE